MEFVTPVPPTRRIALGRIPRVTPLLRGRAFQIGWASCFKKAVGLWRRHAKLFQPVGSNWNTGRHYTRADSRPQRPHD